MVDDNADAAESLAELIGLLGHHVEVAFDGPGAIEKVRQRRPDIVLCDIGLPGMTGYDVARALRVELDGKIRLVAVSGYAQPNDIQKAIDAGFDEHVANPPILLNSSACSGDERPGYNPQCRLYQVASTNRGSVDASP